MKMMGVVIYSQRGGLQDRLEQRFYEERIPFLSQAIVDFSWKRRIDESIEIALCHPDTFLIFLDAWDTMFLGTRKEIEAISLTDYVTFAAQKYCWPDETRKTEYDAIQENPGPWRYINSNPMAGKGWMIASALLYGRNHFPLAHHTNDVTKYDVDERLLTSLYLSEARERYNIRLDTNCELNQTFLGSHPGELWLEDGRVRNTIHNTKPVFVHFNGRTNPPEALLCNKSA